MKLTKEERWERLQNIIIDNGLDVDDLIAFMELTVEDLLEHCKRLLLLHEEKFIHTYWEEDDTYD